MRTLFLLLISISCFAQDAEIINRTLVHKYYVSAAGDGDGSSADPMSFSDLQTLMPTIENYSRVYLNRGDIFEGALQVSKRITLDAYGSGNLPIISGSVNISSQTWTLDTDNVYYTTMAFIPRAIFVNEVEQVKAETEFFNISARTAHNQVSCVTAALDTYHAGQSIVGAEIFGKQFGFQPTRVDTVTAFNGTILTLENNYGLYNSTLGTYAPATNLDFKLRNHRNFIDVVGEWCYDDATSRLYIKTAGGAPTNIYANVEDWGVEIIGGIDYVTIQHIKFKHQFLASIHIDGNNFVTVDSCEFKDGHFDAIYAHGDSRRNTYSYNSFRDYNGSAIELGGVQKFLITRNSIDKIGAKFWINPQEFPRVGPDWRDFRRGIGVGINQFYDDQSAIAIADSLEISYNVIDSVGYNNIALMGRWHNVHHNVLERSCLKWNDGAGIYTQWRPFGFSYGTYGITLDHNIVRNHRGTGTTTEGSTSSLIVLGIYIDNGSSGINITNNTVSNIETFSLFSNYDTKNTSIINNRIRGVPMALHQFKTAYTNNLQKVWSAFPNAVGHTLEDNIFGIYNNNSFCIEVRDADNLTNYNPFSAGGNSDNNHYVNPYTVNIGQYQDASEDNDNLSAWQTRFSDDASSTEFTNFLTYSNDTNARNEVAIEVNTGESPINFNVPPGFVDHEGNAFSNPVTIEPFESLLYFDGP